MVTVYYTFYLMSFTCWPIFIHLDHLQSIFVFKFTKVIVRVLGLIRSRVSSIRSSKCSIIVSRCMRRPNKVSATIISIITCSVIDFSSKLCFEEKHKFLCFHVQIWCNFICSICNNFKGSPGHLTKPLQLHYLQKKNKSQSIQSIKGKNKANCPKIEF